MRILVACEFSGTVRDAFIKKGHEAMSCDLFPSDKPGPHYQGDVVDIINDGWDLMIAHPPCTYLSWAGNVWLKQPGRIKLREDAMDFFMKLINANIPKIAVENPKGYPFKVFRKPDQIIQPYEFGHDAQKSTALWLKNLPILKPTNIVEVTKYWDGKRFRTWVDKVGGGSLSGKKLRSKTFQGIADAMADQWG